MGKKKNKKNLKEIIGGKTEIYNIFDTERNIHEYNIIHTKWDDIDEYELEYSNSAPWSESIRGTKALSIKDDGNGFIFSKEFETDVDYSSALELKLLMSFIFSKNSNISPEYKIYKMDESEIKI
jgi:hypothetical protein